MVLVLVTLGNYLEAGAKRRATSSAGALLASVPTRAWVRRDGGVVETDVADVAIGDCVRVRAGEAVPADGSIVEGTSHVDESILTGESRPRQVNPGDRLLPEDRIRFAVSTPGPGQVMIVSVDKQGEVSLFYPPGPVGGGRTELEGSTILDESRGPERIFSVFSKEALDFGAVEAAVARGLEETGDVVKLEKLPLELVQNSLLIQKGSSGE